MIFALLSGGLVFLIIIWFAVDFYFGRKKHLSTIGGMETAILHSQFEIFTDGKDLFYDYFNEIRKANHHIHVLFYIVKDDAISQEFFSLLKEKAREGVEVRILLDRIGSWKVKQKAVAELREAGIHFAFSNLVRPPFLFYSSQVRNHRKISIIDGKIGYLGGFNIGKEYINEDPVLSPWRDYHLKMSGEGVNFLQSEFMIDWNEYGGENLRNQNAYFPMLPKGEVRHQFIPTEAGELEERFIMLLRQATRTIFIGTPYFIPSSKIFAALLGAGQRGVEIAVIVPYTADHILVQEASFRYLRTLIKQDVAVYQFKNGFYHAKTMIIDDKICDIGTANFDKRSLFLNKEFNCIIYDPGFIERVRQIFKKDLRDSERLTLATLNKPDLWRSIKEGIAGALSNFL